MHPKNLLAATPARRVFQLGVVWLLVYVGLRQALEIRLVAAPWDLWLVCSAIPLSFFGFAWAVERAVQDADELQRRIHLEALALAFPIAMLMLMMLGLFERLQAPHQAQFPLLDLWGTLPPLYGLCLLIAVRRYR